MDEQYKVICAIEHIAVTDVNEVRNDSPAGRVRLPPATVKKKQVGSGTKSISTEDNC